MTTAIKKTTAKAEDLPDMEPMFRDVVDYDKDPGEPWPIGKRRSLVKKKAKEQKAKHLKAAKVEPKEDEEDWIVVYLMLRRMPQEVIQELRDLYISSRDVKDAFGNVRSEEYWENHKMNQMATEKYLWMWIDTKNFWVEVGDEKAVALYKTAWTARGDKAPDTLQVGSMYCVDGNLTDDIKRHLLTRFSVIPQQCALAAQKYDELEKVHEDKLRKNSQSG